MVTQEEIGFECDVQENIRIEDIRKEYKGEVLVWINGSGASPNGKPGAYRCVLEYLGHTKYMEKELPDATANQAMITGAIDAMNCITKPVRVYFISTAALGFVSGFKGSGPNSALIQQLYEWIKKKKCMLTEVQCINCGDTIKRFVYSCNPDATKLNEYDKTLEDKEKRKYQYKEFLYNECINKVIKVLRDNKVDNQIIKEIRTIRPE